ncbi:M20/M25/M40 family metallo-hydrolase [Flavobacterium sp. NRK1]|uniref:M20/M25/M40 family metallo-hydrolase n=1 Tax=Flavobacterium sp. NRK1 TaxID=2954929 RepID=UPI002092432C|nr:M20/M25/M40 family metallo-hydrolase [Flavobacterium sp. NRK1]MCO6147012.1 M20/M25/M40 family metallo-hydrolase [Flavobacterium sp. NRK1]
MKKILYVFLLALLSINSAFAQKRKKTDALYKVHEKSVITTLKFLTSDELKGRNAGTKEAEIAAKYLEDIFVKNGIKPYFISYNDTLTNFTPTTYNVVGYLEGTDAELKKEFVVIGAHYDHIGTTDKPVDGDYIYNGADDNATGTTTVAELVNYYGKMKSNKRSILFCFFSAEEEGLYGSKHLAKKLKDQNFNIYCMLNFEMTGVQLGGDLLAFITGYGRSNMADKFNEYAGKRIIGSNAFEMQYQLFRASDNYPFFLEFNIPSHTLSTTEMSTFKFYHKLDDEFDQMDTTHMTAFIQQMIPVVEKMVNAPTQEIVLKK